MNLLELSEEHRKQAIAIMHDKSIVDPLMRADQLVFGMRHLLCGWILTEATEQQLQEIAAKYSPNHY